MKILLCPLSDGGYLHPAIAAGRELRRRGHHVSVLGRSTAASVAADAGLPFAAAEDFGGHRAFSATWWGPTGAAQYRATLRVAKETGADLLVTSVLCNGALLAAEALDIPVVVVGLSVHLWDYRAGGDDEPHLGRTRQSRTHDCLRIHADVRGRSVWRDGPHGGGTSRCWATRCCCGGIRSWSIRVRGCPSGSGTWGPCPGNRRPTRRRSRRSGTIWRATASPSSTSISAASSRAGACGRGSTRPSPVAGSRPWSSRAVRPTRGPPRRPTSCWSANDGWARSSTAPGSC